MSGSRHFSYVVVQPAPCSFFILFVKNRMLRKLRSRTGANFFLNSHKHRHHGFRVRSFLLATQNDAVKTSSDIHICPKLARFIPAKRCQCQYERRITMDWGISRPTRSMVNDVNVCFSALNEFSLDPSILTQQNHGTTQPGLLRLSHGFETGDAEGGHGAWHVLRSSHDTPGYHGDRRSDTPTHG